MNIEIILKLLALASASVILSVVFYLLEKFTPFDKLPKAAKQIIIGVAFGIVAIGGTQFGVDIGGAVANARDAAPICAGLFFGGPAGIIAGAVGGIWRYIAVAWGAGAYSQLACSLSTFLAGVIAAILRRLMFDGKRPNWIFGLCIGSIIEVMHLSILFMTHMDDPEQAFEIVKICTFPMVFCNGISVMLASILIGLISAGIHRNKKRYHNIAQLVQTPLLIAVIVALIAATVMIYSVQTGSAEAETKSLMSTNLESVKSDILDESDEHILGIARDVAWELEQDKDRDLNELAEIYEVADIYVIDENGIVVRAVDESTIGYDMNSDADLPEEERQSSEFMVLLESDCDEYVQESKPLAIDSETLRKLAGVSLSYGGFVQVGYDSDMFQEELRNQMKILAANRRVGENGYVLIIDEDYNIISNNPEYDGMPIGSYGISLDEIPLDRLYSTSISGTKVYMMAAEAEGFYILAIMTGNEVFASRDNMVYVYSYMEILIFAVLFVIIYIIIKRVVVNNIRSVNTSLGKIIGGNLDTTVDVHSSEEFASLSDDINSTVDTLKRYIDEAAGRIDKELAFAKDIQLSALPSEYPAFPHRTDFDVYATMDTAKEVGGDFYDYYFVGKDRLAFLIADVSGKGIPAAMFMMNAKSVIRDLAETQIPVNEVFTKVNERLSEGNDADMFVTAWMGIIQLDSGHVTFANAGHNPPVVYRKGQGGEYLKSRAGLVLAGMNGVKYRLQEFDMAPGDRLYLYTDGVTEATSSAEELYGEDRLLNYINAHGDLSAQELLKGIRSDIDSFVGDAEQFDDITMVMFDYKGKVSSLNDQEQTVQ